MPRRWPRALLLTFALGVTAHAAAGGQALPDLASSVSLEPVATGLERVVGIVHAGDGSGRLFFVLQPGRIVVYDGSQVRPTPFLDIGGLVSCCGERGLLGLAFHPDYETNGYFFVDYTDVAGDTVVARYRVSTGDPDVADPGSAAIILTVAQPYTNHNGGQLQFGPDGYLYFGLGDGGSGGDPENRAQDLSTLLGKMLRLDVDGAAPYVIPPDNPFVSTPGAKGEIWALGLRNPWRFTFDRATGDMFIGDVGQSSVEEIDFQPASSGGGENYGWRRMEGSQCFNPSTGCNDGTLTLPILEYSHAEGCSVTGGYRYRGPKRPDLHGIYVYGDFCSGRIWGGVRVPNGSWTSLLLLTTPYMISTFGEDEAGELYVADHDASGAVYRFVFTPPVISVDDVRGTESAGSLTFTVRLSAPAAQTVTVSYATSDGSATAGSDYLPASGTLSFRPGVSSRTFSVVVLDDALDEPNEAFLVDLHAPVGGVLGKSRSQGVILDDDGRAALGVPIAYLPFTIAAQGRYFLSRNLSTGITSGAAITIETDFVVLDLEGFKIGGGAAGPATQAVGVYALDRKNVTVINGNVRGFLRGVFLEDTSGDFSASQGHLVAGVRADENTLAGIQVEGRGNVVRGNQVVGTTGSTAFGADADVDGIRVEGPLARVLDNEVLDTAGMGAGAGTAIALGEASGAVVERNRVGRSSGGSSFGVRAISGADVMAVGNRITDAGGGIVYEAATGKYRDNVTSGVATPYSGGTDAGNNH